MNFEQLLQRQLEEALPLQREDGRDWDDVLERAGVRRFRQRQLVLLAAVVVLLGVPSAYAVGPRLAAYFGGSGTPASAVIETSSGRFTMAGSSACWTSDEHDGRSVTTCGLGVLPRCGDGTTPSVPVGRGERVRFVLDLEPTIVQLTFPGTPDAGVVTLANERVTTWRADRWGPVALHAAGRSGSSTGSASYVACLVPR